MSDNVFSEHVARRPAGKVTNFFVQWREAERQMQGLREVMATPTFTDDIFDTARYLLEPLKHDIEYSAPLLTRNKKQHKHPQYHNDVQTEIPGKRTVNMKAKAKARAARKRKR